MGFAVSSAAVILAAWFGYVAGRMSGRNVAYLRGQRDSNRQWRTELRHIDVPEVKYLVARFVPAGTDGRCYPQDCDPDCPGPSLPRTNLRVPMPPVAPPSPRWQTGNGHRLLCDCDECRRFYGA